MLLGKCGELSDVASGENGGPSAFVDLSNNEASCVSVRAKHNHGSLGDRHGFFPADVRSHEGHREGGELYDSGRELDVHRYVLGPTLTAAKHTMNVGLEGPDGGCSGYVPPTQDQCAGSDQ